jgi:hypothetical protein
MRIVVIIAHSPDIYACQTGRQDLFSPTNFHLAIKRLPVQYDPENPHCPCGSVYAKHNGSADVADEPDRLFAGRRLSSYEANSERSGAE